MHFERVRALLYATMCVYSRACGHTEMHGGCRYICCDSVCVCVYQWRSHASSGERLPIFSAQNLTESPARQRSPSAAQVGCTDLTCTRIHIHETNIYIYIYIYKCVCAYAVVQQCIIEPRPNNSLPMSASPDFMPSGRTYFKTLIWLLYVPRTIGHRPSMWAAQNEWRVFGELGVYVA